LPVDPAAAASASIIVVDRHNFGSAATRAIEEGVLTQANHAYREALMGEDQLVALTDGQGQVASYGFILFDSFYKRVLGEPHGTPMISNCYTMPAQRGRACIRGCCSPPAGNWPRKGIGAPSSPVHRTTWPRFEASKKPAFGAFKTLHSLVLVARWIVFQRGQRALE